MRKAPRCHRGYSRLADNPRSEEISPLDASRACKPILGAFFFFIVSLRKFIQILPYECSHGENSSQNESVIIIIVDRSRFHKIVCYLNIPLRLPPASPSAMELEEAHSDIKTSLLLGVLNWWWWTANCSGFLLFLCRWKHFLAPLCVWVFSFYKIVTAEGAVRGLVICIIVFAQSSWSSSRQSVAFRFHINMGTVTPLRFMLTVGFQSCLSIYLFIRVQLFPNLFELWHGKKSRGRQTKCLGRIKDQEESNLGLFCLMVSILLF